jgi:hypothetical protein
VQCSREPASSYPSRKAPCSVTRPPTQPCASGEPLPGRRRAVKGGEAVASASGRVSGRPLTARRRTGPLDASAQRDTRDRRHQPRASQHDSTIPPSRSRTLRRLASACLHAMPKPPGISMCRQRLRRCAEGPFNLAFSPHAAQRGFAESSWEQQAAAVSSYRPRQNDYVESRDSQLRINRHVVIFSCNQPLDHSIYFIYNGTNRSDFKVLHDDRLVYGSIIYQQFDRYRASIPDRETYNDGAFGQANTSLILIVAIPARQFIGYISAIWREARLIFDDPLP